MWICIVWPTRPYDIPQMIIAFVFEFVSFSISHDNEFLMTSDLPKISGLGWAALCRPRPEGLVGTSSGDWMEGCFVAMAGRWDGFGPFFFGKKKETTTKSQKSSESSMGWESASLTKAQKTMWTGESETLSKTMIITIATWGSTFLGGLVENQPHFHWEDMGR